MCPDKEKGKRLNGAESEPLPDNLDFCFWSFDCTQKKYTTVTSICSLIPDFKSDEQAGDSPNLIASFIHPDDRPTVEKAFTNIMSQGAIERVGCRIVLPDNSRHFVRLHLKSRRNDRGEVEFVDCVLNHFPDRNDGGQAVKTSENVFLQMAEFSPDIIFVHSLGRVVYINKTGIKLLKGSRAEDFVGRNVKDFIHPDYAGKIEARVRKAIELNETMPFMKEKILCLDGSSIDVEVSCSPLIFMGDDAIQVVGRDITRNLRIDQMRIANFKISEAINTTGDLNSLLSKIHGILSELVTTSNFCVALYDRLNGLYKVPYCANEYECSSTEDISNRKNLIDYIRRTGKPLIADRRTYQELKDKGEVVGSSYEPVIWLGIPMAVNDRFTGVISIQSYDDVGICTSEDLEMLTVFSDKIALAVERKINEENLLINEQLLSRVIDLVPFMIYAKDSQGRYIFCNKEAAKLHGMTPMDMVGKTMRDLVEWNSEYDSYLSNEDEVIRSGKTVFVPDVAFTDAHDKKHYIQVTKIPIKLAGYVDNCILVVALDMTEQREVEKRLRRSENQYRATLDAMKDYIHVVDRKLNITLANAAFVGWLKVLDIKREAVGSNVRELFPFLKKNVYDEYEQVFTEGKLLLTEESNEFEGRVIFTETRKIPIFEGGRVKQVMTVIRDTTRQKEDHRALAENEMRLKLALESSSDGLWEWSTKTRRAYFSPRLYTMLGYEPDEFEPTYESWLDLIHPDDQPLAERMATELVEGKTDHYSIEFRLRTKEGGWKWIYSRGKYVEWDENGFPLRMVGTHIDISDLKKTQKALQQRESMISSIFRAAPTGIGLVVDRVLINVNDRFCEMVGYTPEELVGNSSRILYESDEEFDRVGQMRRQVDSRHGIGTIETRFVRKDGRVIDIRLSLTAMDDNDTVDKVTFTALNITESKLAEKALHSALKKMEEDQKTLTEKNVALREVLNQIENEKRQIQLQIQSNVDKILMPMIANIQNRIDPLEYQYVEVLKNTLMDITSPFINKLNSLYSKLTPREIEICNMIKSGMTSKEIALTLKISVETVHKTRYNIRRKFGILNEEINLTSFLKTI